MSLSFIALVLYAEWSKFRLTESANAARLCPQDRNPVGHIQETESFRFNFNENYIFVVLDALFRLKRIVHASTKATPTCFISLVGTLLECYPFLFFRPVPFDVSTS